MSKAEDKARQKALERFPILFGERTGCDKTNLQQERRNAYEKGYLQAEKDLALTWEDVKLIWNITDEMDNMPEEEFYQEVLKRFNTQKGK